MICKSAPMGARTPRCADACAGWWETPRKVFFPPTPMSPRRPARHCCARGADKPHTVVVNENGFEYEGQRYRSLTVIAERITGAHWSGPRFFGLTKRTSASLPAEANK